MDGYSASFSEGSDEVGISAGFLLSQWTISFGESVKRRYSDSKPANLLSSVMVSSISAECSWEINLK
jgi:hypothetical protein